MDTAPQHNTAAADVAARQLARRAIQYMFEQDRASQALGITLDAIEPGRACLSMRVREDMINGYGTCHGGFIFALADSAFQFACNSRNDATVALGGTIEFLRPGHAGDLLHAEAAERSLVGRSGVYDVSVSNAAGETVALFRGKSRRVRGQVLPERDAP